MVLAQCVLNFFLNYSIKLKPLEARGEAASIIYTNKNLFCISFMSKVKLFSISCKRKHLNSVKGWWSALSKAYLSHTFLPPHIFTYLLPRQNKNENIHESANILNK